MRLSEKRIIDSTFDHSLLEGSCCAIGVFDGLHSGHAELIKTAVNHACQFGCRSVVISFDTDPDQLFSKPGFKKILSDEDRIEALRTLGADIVAVLPFTREFASLEPLAFLNGLFADYSPMSIHVGEDFRFGNKAAGSIDTLCSWALPLNISIVGYPLVCRDGRKISSTHIRECLSQHDLNAAEELLGHPYYLTMPVVKGRGEGNKLGFPTANCNIAPVLSLLPDGVYGCYALVDDGCYKAAVNIGIPPFAQGAAHSNCEVNILDFNGDLYGRTIRIVFKRYLRPMRTFASAQELSECISENVQQIQDTLPANPDMHDRIPFNLL